MANFAIEVYTPTGSQIADLSGLQESLQLEFTRNRAPSINIDFDLNKLHKLAVAQNVSILDMLDINYNEIRVRRNGMVISAGQIAQADVSTQNEVPTLVVRCVGWLDLFVKRRTAVQRIFTGVDAGIIAWTLLSETQAQTNGDWGIVQGVIQASQNRDRDYASKVIKDAIIELSEVINGFDFEITWDKKFNVYYPKIGQHRTDITLTYPGNINNLGYSRQGLEVTNKVYAFGQLGTDQLIATASDTTNQAKYKLREDKFDYNDIINLPPLQQHADAELAARKGFPDLPTIKLSGERAPEFGTYGLGDVIPIETNDPMGIYTVLNGDFRIDAMSLVVDKENHEEVTLKVMR